MSYLIFESEKLEDPPSHGHGHSGRIMCLGWRNMPQNAQKKCFLHWYPDFTWFHHQTCYIQASIDRQKVRWSEYSPQFAPKLSGHFGKPLQGEGLVTPRPPKVTWLMDFPIIYCTSLESFYPGVRWVIGIFWGRDNGATARLCLRANPINMKFQNAAARFFVTLKSAWGPKNLENYTLQTKICMVQKMTNPKISDFAMFFH